MRDRSLRALCWAALALVAGLVWRLAPLGLPKFLFKYGGSVLWALMIYWLFVAALPKKRPAEVGMWAAVFAAAVECLRLFHTTGLDRFRATLAGKLLIGTHFSIWDIAAYWLAIAVAVLWTRHRRSDL
ncbi:MAG TPA: DUF2809 domain-containing protein [Fimbriimonas sp.]|nr:DUF2809 domain-containing protein [Fimbriimonas sp.]